MQFINYILRGHSFEQSIICTPTLFKRFFNTYVCLDLYHETVGVATIEVWFSQHGLPMTFFITEITEHILLAT